MSYDTTPRFSRLPEAALAALLLALPAAAAAEPDPKEARMREAFEQRIAQSRGSKRPWRESPGPALAPSSRFGRP